MDADSDGPGQDRPGPGSPFAAVDSKLNIFALANGLDLLKSEGPPPTRALEWYRDGMERRIRLAGGEGGTLTITVEASRKVDGVPHRALASFRHGVDAEALRQSLTGILEEGIERANALERSELEPAAG